MLFWFSANHGKEFYFGVLPNVDSKKSLVITIASEKNGLALFNVPFFNISKQINIFTGSTRIDIGTALQKQGNFTEYRGIYLMSSVDISLFVTSHSYGSTDSYNAMPLELLGMQYIVASLKPVQQSVFSVIGVYNQTDVLMKFLNGKEEVTSINRLEVYQKAADFDLTGTVVISNKPVAVISGNKCAELGGGACDMTMTSLLPSKYFGKTFILPTEFNKEKFMIRAMALDTDVTVFVDQVEYAMHGTLLKITNVSNTLVVVSSKPIQVVQYIQHDPYVANIPCVDNYRSKYIFSIPSVFNETLNFSHYISVVIPDRGVNGLLIDNNYAPPAINSYDVHVPFDNFTVLVYHSTMGFHTVEQIDGIAFLVFAFGISSTGYGKYGYVVGLEIKQGILSSLAKYVLV